MDKRILKKKWYCLNHRSLALLLFLQWVCNFGAADPGSSFNLTAAGFAWMSTTDGADVGEWNVENDGRIKPVAEEAANTEVETAFSSIDSMFQWAIGHADTEKLKGTSTEVLQGMSAKQLEERQSELKEVMEKLRVKSDAELMNISLADLQNNSSPAADRQRALQELLLLVEPIDSAIDLYRLGGLEIVVGELDREEGDLRTTAAWVLGKATQNNPVVQGQLLRLGALPKLMTMVGSNDGEEASKAFYALSALIRNFQSSREAFYLNGGTLLLQMLLTSEIANPRLQKKALFLIADLAEQQQFETRGQIDSYTLAIDDKLLKSVVRLTEADDLDTQEKALMAIRSLIGLNSSVCERLREVCGVEAVLERLRVRYQELMLDPEQADYIKDLEVLRDEVAESL